MIPKCCFKPNWIAIESSLTEVYQHEIRETPKVLFFSPRRAVKFVGDSITDLCLLAGRLLGSLLLAAVLASIIESLVCTWNGR